MQMRNTAIKRKRRMKDVKKTIKRLFAAMLAAVLMIAVLGGCTESGKRALVDMKSEYLGGLDRTVTVYTADGEVIASYSGKIDIESSAAGYVKFDFEGKRYIYYNCFVETIADIC